MKSNKDTSRNSNQLSWRWRRWRNEAAALLLLALIAVVFFWPVVTGRAWIPHGGGDLVSFIYPMYRFAAASLSAGNVPLWNPYLYAGAPFIADNQSGVFYPFNLLLFLVNPDFGFREIEALVIWHFIVAGAGMYACLRWLRPERPVAPFAALLGAVAFMLSGVFITHIGNLNLIAVAAWLPLAFIGLHRAVNSGLRSSAMGWAIGGGVSLGVGTLAGHGQSTFLIAFFLVIYALYRSVVNRTWRALSLLMLLGLVAMGTAAIGLFPALESIGLTLRGEFTPERSVNYSLPPKALVGLIAPDYYGRGVDNFWGTWPRVEYGYVGVVSLLVAAVGIFRKPSKNVLFFALATVFFFVLALGSNTPIYRLLFGGLPMMPFQVPARFVLLGDFCLATLAALGTDRLLRGDLSAGRWRHLAAWLALAAGGLLVVLFLQSRSEVAIFPERESQMLRAMSVFGLLSMASLGLIAGRARGAFSANAAGVMAFGLLSVDMVGLGRFVEVEWNDPTLGYAEGSAALHYLKSDPGIHRVDLASAAWQPSLPQIEGLYSIGGVFNPLQLSNYSVYVGSMGSRGSPLYNLLGVKYVIGDKVEPPADTRFIVPVYDVDPQVNVYLNTRAIPRAAVIFEADVVASHDAAFDAIHAAAFDPMETLILESGKPLRQEGGSASIEVREYAADYSAFEVSTDREAYFLLTDIDHPHWKAMVNGADAQFHTADYAFRAVYLERGDHLVEFRYDPPGWHLGLAISIGSWMAILLFTFWKVRQWHGRPNTT